MKRGRRDEGSSLTELLVVLLLVGVAAGFGLPRLSGYADEARLRGAAYFLRGLAREMRRRAASQSRYIGIVFFELDGAPALAVHADGNGNGIRRRELDAGVDPRVGPVLRWGELFPGVRFGRLPDGAAEPPLAGVRLGPSDILSFSPLGEASSGTLYLTNPRGTVYGVTVYGGTGRVRIRRWTDGRWELVL